MKLLIWLLSLKRQKPRDPSWYWEAQERWDPRGVRAADEKARTEIQRQLRRNLGKETP